MTTTARPPYTITRQRRTDGRPGRLRDLRINGVYAGTYETRRQAQDAYDALYPHLTACEVHDLPGLCDEECLTLAQQMAGPGHTCDEDPTGCSYVPADYDEPTDRLVLQDATVTRVRA